MLTLNGALLGVDSKIGKEFWMRKSEEWKTENWKNCGQTGRSRLFRIYDPCGVARPVRFELTTPCSGGMYSIHLSYGRTDQTSVDLL